MNEEIELNGARYKRISGVWYDAKTGIKPPNVIIQQLNARSSLPTTKSQTSSLTDETTFAHQEAFPIIAKIIQELYAHKQSFVRRDEIAYALLLDSKGRIIIEDAQRKAEQNGTQHDIQWRAGNVVDWFGSAITQHLSEYEQQFERVRIDGKLAYKPKQSK